MQDVFDIYTIIFLALAVFIFLRLRSVLGQRTGRERPPYDPYAAREPVRPPGENVVSLPNRVAEATVSKAGEPAESAAPVERWKGIADAGSPLALGLDAVAGADREFDAKHFIAGARAAYEMIVNAYAEGDRRTLKNLLSREVYDGFEGAIVVGRVKEMKADEGFNAQSGKYEDLVKAGVIDPAKVVRSALQNAASIASLLLTTEAVISQMPDKKSKVAAIG